jgi:hypothetical protein
LHAFIVASADAHISGSIICRLSSYHELNDKYTSHFGRKYPGHLVVLSQVVNLLLMGDYCYYYMGAARRKENFILPQTL